MFPLLSHNIDQFTLRDEKCAAYLHVIGMSAQEFSELVVSWTKCMKPSRCAHIQTYRAENGQSVKSTIPYFLLDLIDVSAFAIEVPIGASKPSQCGTNTRSLTVDRWQLRRQPDK